MKNTTKYILISVGLIGSGVLLYTIFKSNKKEDNGKQTDEDSPNPLGNQQELENTTGSNPIMIGDEIYPSGEYVNVRSTPEVDDGWFSNKIGKVDTPNRIGIVNTILVSDGHTWYGVQLNQQEIMGQYLTGYVRADVVTKNI